MAREKDRSDERGGSVVMERRGSQVLYQPEDRVIFNDLMRIAHRKRAAEKSMGELILDIGKHFLGAPYANGTLEREGKESLVINLREFDCVTLVENSMALAAVIKSGEISFDRFAKRLKTARYRDGIIKGYPSRLHYFTDWLRDNSRKGLLREVTAEIGGVEIQKEINFMTGHPELYPRMRSKDVYQRMRVIEKRLSVQRNFFLPKREVKRRGGGIHDGDIIAITTDKEGLDVLHVGLAIRIREKIHLLHASEKAGMVLISRESLPEYLRRGKNRSGIMVARPL